MVVIYTKTVGVPMFQIEVEYSYTQSSSGVSTTVSATAYARKLHKDAKAWNNFGVNFGLSIGGNNKNITWKFDYRNSAVNSRHTISSHSYTVAHNKSTGIAPKVTISAYCVTDTNSIGTISGSTSFTPPPISVYKAVGTAGTPSVPTLKAGTNARITWAHAAMGSNGVREYKVEWSGYTSGSSAGLYNTTYYDYPVPINANSSMRFRIRTSDGVNVTYSAWSAYKAMSLAPPTAASAPTFGQSAPFTHGTSVKVNWGAVSRATDYGISYTASNGDSGVIWYLDVRTGYLPINAAWSSVKVRVATWNKDNPTVYGTYSASQSCVRAIVAPTVPSNVTIPSRILERDGSITVSWGASTPTPTDYRVEVSINGGNYATVRTTTSRSTSFTLASSQNTLRFRVRAWINDGGGYSDWGYSSTVSVIHPASVPSSISVPTPYSVNGTVNISWAQASNATTYYLAVSVDGGGYSSVYSGSALSSSFPVKASHDTLKFRVHATGAGGDSGYRYSDTLTVVHPAPPLAPSNVRINTEIRGGKLATVYWNAGSGAEQYYVSRKFDNGAYSDEIRTTSLSMTYAVPRGYNTVMFRVRANNADGYSSYAYSSSFPIKNFAEMGIKVNGVLKSSDSGWVKVNGVLKEIDTITIKQNGILKEI